MHKMQARAFGIEPATIDALMANAATAPVEENLKPILSYAAKLTLSPARMVEADAKAVYATGWSEAALFDAIQVCGLFNLMNRMLEGTGITTYHRDPETAGEEDLNAYRGEDTYSAFGRMNGVGK